MSTKISIKARQRAEGQAGYHLYDDILDSLYEHVMGDPADYEASTRHPEPPVYLRLDGVAVELNTLPTGGASVTLSIPRDVARELGLVPPVDSSPPAGPTAPGPGESPPES